MKFFFPVNFSDKRYALKNFPWILDLKRLGMMDFGIFYIIFRGFKKKFNKALAVGLMF